MTHACCMAHHRTPAPPRDGVLTFNVGPVRMSPITRGPTCNACYATPASPLVRRSIASCFLWCGKPQRTPFTPPPSVADDRLYSCRHRLSIE